MSAKKEQARKDGLITQFRQVTGASQVDASKFLKKHGYRLDAALDGLYNDPAALAALSSGQPSQSSGANATKKLGDLFDKYKDSPGDTITVEGTMAFAEDIGLDLGDVGLIALAHELKSPQMGVFTRAGWIDGWKALRCDSIPTIQAALPKLRARLSSEPEFFKTVYLYAFDFAKAPGQRSIPMDSAKAFWEMLLPVGQEGAALKTTSATGQGFKPEYNQWWFDFLAGKGSKGVSRDSWNMFLDFILSIDSKFEQYDEEASWPSIIDEFVENCRARIIQSS